MKKKSSTYTQILEHIFFSHYKKGDKEVHFQRQEIVDAAESLGLPVPKNIGDVVYSPRYRAELAEGIRKTASKDTHWIIRPAGSAKYRFCLVPEVKIAPSPRLAATKVPDSTPGIIAKYALSDEQALLAKLRYNRLVDIFTGIACYSLQNHLRTAVPSMGQIETDEIYVGVDKNGVQYVIPIQAKGGRDKLGLVQVEQDLALCAHRFPDLVCRPIAAQFMKNGAIAMFEFEESDEGVSISTEKHYQLVSPEKISAKDLERYRNRLG